MNLSKDEQREKLYRLLGDLPDRELPVKVQMLAEEKREGYYLEKLLLHLNGMEPVPAYFIRPNDVSGKLPAVLFNHSHGVGDDTDGTSKYKRPPNFPKRKSKFMNNRTNGQTSSVPHFPQP
nr:hypothetical protein [Aneurinibacillus sp. XH2]